MVIKLNEPYSKNGGEKEWLEQRKKFITATEASALMGVNPYITPSKLLKEKPLPPTKLISPFLDRGLENEESVLLLAETWLEGELMEEFKDPNNRMFYANESTRIGATPDGILKDGRMVEVKCSGIKNLKAWGKFPPLYYIMQCQVQMYVTGARENYIMARFFYNWPNVGCSEGANKLWKVKYKEEILKILVDKVENFWYCLSIGKSIRIKSVDKDLHSNLLKDTCKEVKERIVMEKFEIDPMQLKIIRQTCFKAAAKMEKADPEATVKMAETIEKEIFFKVGEACADGSRNFMIQLGACVNAFVEAKPKGSFAELKKFVFTGIKHVAK